MTWGNLTTDLPLDMMSSALLRYTGYVSFTCTNSCNRYDSYENADIWFRLLAIVGRVMTSTGGNLRECVQ
jgi:hypothetical protein